MAYIGPGGGLIGYSIDLMHHIAREMNYKLEVTECSFDGLIPAVQSGKCDVVGGSMSITPERAKTIDFCDPFYDGASVFIIHKADADPSLLEGLDEGAATEQDDSFFGSIAANVKKTFVDEDRWKIFLEGLATTLIITLASAVFGTALGFLIYLLCRKLGAGFKRIINLLAGLVVGIPIIVLLMVFFYIVFGAVSLGGLTVSIITFTLLYGISVYNMMEQGANAIDRGQTEGAYALGFNDRETYFNVILPQSLAYVLPIYKGELPSLLKSTAVVGYIVVQDLTRAGDIVRNRTFEAFFALISVAIIYYLIGRLLAWVITRIQVRLDPTRRKPEQILKGIDVNV